MKNLKLQKAPYFNAELSFIEALAEGFTFGDGCSLTLPVMELIASNVQAYYDSRADLSIPITLKNGDIVPRIKQADYWLIENDDTFIGQISLRAAGLSESLREDGGHIGYSIRPSIMGKGYATKMLKLLLQQIDKTEYPYILITCNENNLGSAKVIEKNSGILQDIIETKYSTEHKICRYHIQL